MQKKEKKKAAFDKLLKARPKAVALAERVRIGRIAEDRPLPRLATPALEGVELAAWVRSHRQLVDEELERHGGLLFRGFGVDSVAAFQELAQAAFSELVEYGERSSPRSRIEGRVYTSTDHPADQEILLHNEQSYTLEWPMRICFCCAVKARRGGDTPLADSRRILGRLDPRIVAEFERRQLTYVRNYGAGMGLDWQEVFQTGERSQVEAHCRRAGIELEWKGDGRLQTRQVRPAVRRHPVTGEKVWFNHAMFFHVSSLEPATRDALLASFAEEDLPFNTYYGDGGAIEPEVLEEIRGAYRAETTSFPWQQGDVLVLDNMLVAHGRQSFEGPRKILTVMAEPVAAESVAAEAVAGEA